MRWAPIRRRAHFLAVPNRTNTRGNHTTKEPKETVADLKAANIRMYKTSEAWRENAGYERKRNLQLAERVRTRDETIVQLGIRLAAYGDPAGAAAVSPARS